MFIPDNSVVCQFSQWVLTNGKLGDVYFFFDQSVSLKLLELEQLIIEMLLWWVGGGEWMRK